VVAYARLSKPLLAISGAVAGVRVHLVERVVEEVAEGVDDDVALMNEGFGRLG
jgi:hypothetical protein